MTKLTNEQYREQAAAKVAAAQELLAAEVAALVTGADWRRFLDAQARLHDCGASDVMLIFAQHAQAYEEGRVPEPTPTYVAGFDTWAALDRRVTLGQHGYTTLAPMRSTCREARDPEGNVRVLARGETPAAGESERTRTVVQGFRAETIFDASQTTGSELAELIRPKVGDGEAPAGLGVAVLELIEDRGWKVTTVADATWVDGADSRAFYGGKFLTIRGDMDDQATVRTLVSGAAHVLLHDTPPGRYLPQPVKEVEAQSVAYVVAAVHGMTTDSFQFPDIATWADKDTDRAVRDSQARINRAAQAIIAASPADHEPGSKPPGTDLAVAAKRQADQEGARRDAELRARLAGRTDEGPPSAAYEGPGVA